MRILFTKGDTLLSKLIRNATGEEISHVALEFPGLGIVVHSNLLGLHIEWAENFYKHCQVIYSIEVPNAESDQNQLARLLADHEWAPYDFGALLFLGISLSLRSYLGIPLPKSNLWQSSGMFLCTETVNKYLGRPIDSMITPYKLYLELRESALD